MFKRPSSRRKSQSEGVNLNLVPILDAMVTLISFLLFTMSFLTFVHVESPFPMVDATTQPEQIKEKPLQLTVSLGDQHTRIWSPFEKFPAKSVPNLPDGLPDMKVIHETLIQVKMQFPNERKVVIAPTAGTSYDVLVSLMDTIRLIEKTDPVISAKNKDTGVDETVKLLFPEVVFGNLLGDS